jgi:hypothetical protein
VIPFIEFISKAQANHLLGLAADGDKVMIYQVRQNQGLFLTVFEIMSTEKQLHKQFSATIKQFLEYNFFLLLTCDTPSSWTVE